VNRLLTAVWAEALKAGRSRVFPFTLAGFSALPLVDGLFMFILKDPERARAMGLIGAKAQLTAGVADWPAFFQVLLLGTAVGGAVLFAFITAWVFGREFSDHTVKELLAIPTPREVIVGAKFIVITIWTLGLAVLIFVVGVGVGRLVEIPGWTPELQASSFGSFLLAILLTLMLMPFVALLASAGRGYLPPLGWAFLTMALGQIAIVLGWGDWLPWSVPGLLGSLSGSPGPNLEPHSYAVVAIAFVVGTAATFGWWRSADQAR
jgi:ABC-2 type transport system permease protein